MSSKQAQALAIKLSRERRAGKNIPPPPEGRYSRQTREKVKKDLEVGRARRKHSGRKKQASGSPRRKKSSRAKKRSP